MADSLIIQKAMDEVERQHLALTKQLLAIHEVVYEENKPKVLRVDTDGPAGSAIVYFPIKNEKFYLAVYLNTEPDISVSGVATEPYHIVEFSATSETLNFEQLSSLTRLKATSGWSKGDVRQSGTSFHRVSVFNFEPNPGPAEFENKLIKLLDALEQDKEGVLALASQAYVLIQVGSIFHNGNTMLGGHHISKESMKRIASLELPIDFDLYAKGNFFKG